MPNIHVPIFFLQKKLNQKFADLWNFIQHFVFGLIGAEIDVSKNKLSIYKIYFELSSNVDLANVFISSSYIVNLSLQI